MSYDSCISVKVDTSIYWYILPVAYTGTSEYIIVLLFCSLLQTAGRLKAANLLLRVPKVWQKTPVSSCNKLILSQLSLEFAAGSAAGCRGWRRRGQWGGRRRRRQSVAADEDLDGDIVGGNKFVFESHARAPSILRMPSQPTGAVMNLRGSRMCCGDVDVATKVGTVGYMIFQSLCSKISNN
jgi:hypothetical protein